MLALLLALTTPATGHPLSYTEGWWTLREDGAFQVDLFTSPEDLPLGDPREAPNEAERARREAGILEFWRAQVRPMADGAPLAVSASLADGARPPLTLVRLEGTLPAKVSTLSWTQTADAGTVVLTLREAGAPGARIVKVGPGGSSGELPLHTPRDLGIGAVIAAWVALGFVHIVPDGLDHVLFVLGLFFASPKLRDLLVQVSAFTVAHTATLGLATLGYVALPAEVVEPLIALSIAWVAVENLLLAEPGRWRPAVVFGFGLLHGLGFAGVLSALPLEPSALLTQLLAFNVGVELGQLAVIGAAAALTWRWREDPRLRTYVARPLSGVIGAVGLFWFVERAFFGG